MSKLCPPCKPGGPLIGGSRWVIMRIRWKLLILLLLVALVPLVFIAATMNRSTKRLGETIGQRASQVLTARAENELGLLVASQAEIIGREARTIELIVQLQAQAARECLAHAHPPARPAFFVNDFETPETLPFELTSPRRYQPSDPGAKPLRVSLDQQVLVVAPGVNRDSIAADILRLAGLTPVYRSLFQQYPDQIFWQYTALDVGLHGAFPGHGKYPPDFDPRTREWYQRAKELDSIRWLPPYVDAASGKLVLTCSMPVQGPDGRFAGVTAVDMAVGEFIEQTRLPSFGSPASYLVGLSPRTRPENVRRLRDIDVKAYRPEELGLMVFLHPTEAKAMSLRDGAAREWLESADRDTFLGMLADMQAGKCGVRQMAFKGGPSMWAFGPVWKNTVFSVVVVPYEEIVAEAAQAQQTILDLTNRQLRLRALIALAVIFIVLAIAFYGSRHVTRPIRQLAEAAGRIAAGDLDARVEVRTHDEIGQLGGEFNAMVPALKDRMRLRQSLTLAMEVQQCLLPSSPPKVPGLDVAGTSIYCDETGGDYYDFLDLSELRPGELGIAVGDVTGHGIAAALLMTSARAVLRSSLDRSDSLADLMRKMNYHLTVDTPAGRFMTLFYLVIDGGRRSLRFANAGHDPTLLYDPASDRFEELHEGGLPLGIMEEADYQESRREYLTPGQVLVIGTDGIWEMHNSRNEMFGKDALRELVRRNAAGSAADIMKAVTEALVAFRADFPQQDDVTLVVVKIMP